jgi:hypothetical protein
MATADWYYQVMGAEVGPISSVELADKALVGRITLDTLVRRGSSGEWVPASKVNGLFPAPPVATPTTLKPPPASRPVSSSPDEAVHASAVNNGSGCAVCGVTIIFGGVREGGDLYCSDKCHDHFKAARKKAGGGIFLVGKQGKTLYVFDDVIRIEKNAWLLAKKREKSIPIRNITSVEVKEPGPVVVGFIQLSIGGGKSRDSSFTWTGGAVDAASDENSVLFTWGKEYKIALKVKAYVEAWSAKHEQPVTVQAAAPVSVADEIRKLKALLDEGLLTAEEFDQEKRRLLAK